MTNTKIRKLKKPAETEQSATGQEPHQRSGADGANDVSGEATDEESSLDESLWQTIEEAKEDENTGGKPAIPLNKHHDEDDEDDDDDDDDVDSSSSFSLQECIDEFRARRLRRFSTQSRDAAMEGFVGAGGGSAAVASEGFMEIPADEDIINQNRSNKEQERKCKPCQNGLCYCFTSDSGDGSCAAREGHVRQPRRYRKSESSQLLQHVTQRLASKSSERQQQHRRSAPATLRGPQETEKDQQTPKATETMPRVTSRSMFDQRQLTAVSRLEAAPRDAPLIHIIQELHNNCVISEVRVNKYKIQEQQQQRKSQSLSTQSSPRKAKFILADPHEPTAPTIEDILAETSACKEGRKVEASAPPLDKISEVDTQSDSFIAMPLNANSKSSGSESRRRRHKAGGRLLNQRLAKTQTKIKPFNLSEPPPKPPRRSGGSYEEKSSESAGCSSSPSVRAAERVVDEFLRSRGVKVPGEEQPRMKKSPGGLTKGTQVSDRDFWALSTKPKGRRSYPMTLTEHKFPVGPPLLPTCPSLSDIERAVDSKERSHYEKNLRKATEKPVKELSFGWVEPKIADMLNYDRNGNRKEFKSQAIQAGPQAIGWQAAPLPQQRPHKIDLDTVDGGELENLASNMDKKETPVKTRVIATGKKKPSSSGRQSQRFIWGEKWAGLSPKLNIKSSPRTLLRKSKNKILRFVSPKKDNQNDDKARKSMVNVAVQTTPPDMASYESSFLPPHSPPGSYHSPVPNSGSGEIAEESPSTPTRSTSRHHQPPGDGFDFSRTVHSPPKKATRPTPRRLNFPLNCTAGSDDAHSLARMTKTYRSYHSDLDQDVTLSKLNYVLGNIRAKLEASDEHATRTFEEIGRREQQNSTFDCVDGRNELARSSHHLSRPIVHHNYPSPRGRDLNEAIYSEIEEDSIHISSDPQHENKTGQTRMLVPMQNHPETLYAKVNKPPRPRAKNSPPAITPLGKVLHDSLKERSIPSLMQQLPPLPPLPSDVYEASGDSVSERSGAASYSSPPITPSVDGVDTSAGGGGGGASSSGGVSQPLSSNLLSNFSSLNNIRVMEQHSEPKKYLNHSKSELSLHRSEIFLDNLCRSEIIVEDGDIRRLEKVDNDKIDCSVDGTHVGGSSANFNISHDSVSYDELPGDMHLSPDRCDYNQEVDGQFGRLKQSTPKKSSNEAGIADRSQTFYTKLFDAEKTQSDNQNVSSILHNHSSSLRNLQWASIEQTSINAPASHTLASGNSSNGSPAIANTSKKWRCERLRNVLRESYRKSKSFLKRDKTHMSTSLPPSICDGWTEVEASPSIDPSHPSSVASSSFNLDSLFNTNDEVVPVQQQLAQTVSICRQLPVLEISPEMVEAERLLLFSTLQHDLIKRRSLMSLAGHRRRRTNAQDANQPLRCRFHVDAMRLPVKADVSHDFFFNYFYIATFMCGGAIKSTQSVECQNQEVIFRDCAIDLSCGGDLDFTIGHDDDDESESKGAEVQCEIFMLRLRKVSTLSLEPQRSTKLPKIAMAHSSKSSSSSSGDGIVSRFRLHASFTLSAKDFVPYQVSDEPVLPASSYAELSLESACNFTVPLVIRTKSTNLGPVIQLVGSSKLQFVKRHYEGFLNVQDPHTMHNWNRRWCSLEGLHLSVWEDVNSAEEKPPLLTLDLRNNTSEEPLTMSPRELCARPRSFCLQCPIGKAGPEEEESVGNMAAVFFAADTHADLIAWLEQLNAVLSFVREWMK